LLSRKNFVQHFSSSYLSLKIIILDIVGMERENGNNVLEKEETIKDGQLRDTSDRQTRKREREIERDRERERER
jgi:hypothetical protein